jgi:hypothetical protein
MDMIIIHTTALGTTPPQHSLFHMEAQAMAMTTVHTTLRGMILTHHLVWRMKGEVMAMTTDCIIQLLTPLPPRSVMPMNNQATTLTTIRIIVSQTILLRLICGSLRKITASIVRNGTRFITSTLVRHLVRVGLAADLMRQTLTRTSSDSWRSLQRQYNSTKHVVIRMLEFRSAQFCVFEKIFCRCALPATHICSFRVYLLCFYFPKRGI